LNRHGLVDISPRRGVRVAPLHAEILLGLAQLLSTLTLLAVRRCAEHAIGTWPAAPIAILRCCADRLEGASPSPESGAFAVDTITTSINELCDLSDSSALASAINARIAQYRFLTANRIDQQSRATMAIAWRALADAVGTDATQNPSYQAPLTFAAPGFEDTTSDLTLRAFGDAVAAPLPNYPEIQSFLDDVDAFVLPDVREHPTLPGQIAARIRELIHAGEYGFGERITETDLAERFLTSRGPVRDAIRILDEQGLVEIRSRRGAIVRKLPPERLGELYDIRDGVAMMVARLAADRGPPTKQWRELFDKGVSLMQSLALRPDLKPIVWIEMRRSLSKLVYSLARNDPASRLASEIENQLATHYVAQEQQATRDQVVSGWRAMGEAIKDCDAEAATRAVHAMVLRSKQLALDAMQHSDQSVA
jgi:DNA-binding GntR family transcriptional regulator